ncbi:hypothetical protein HUK80_02050 [Flavobacterium sp. MAH-1]|uniref:Uncharacterized protein n=1 Tax=Flavobacterium agri TaxID=2743471 RepID=A0A7Y8Y0H2_9FLAO|nr:hypothetical protein [Flavobacterium agri]NUY79663.1 hypothetical protein [Flavobacterium agri]NYA69688.1 hypothetical protein [Flavobacterium agri]
MEDKINTLEDLKEPAAHAFHVVEPSKNRKGMATVRIPVNSYAELSYYLIDALKVSVAALDAEHEDVTAVRNVSSAVGGVLEKLIEIIPLEEMVLLDKVRELVSDAAQEKQPT